MLFKLSLSLINVVIVYIFCELFLTFFPQSIKTAIRNVGTVKNTIIKNLLTGVTMSLLVTKIQLSNFLYIRYHYNIIIINIFFIIFITLSLLSSLMLLPPQLL